MFFGAHFEFSASTRGENVRVGGGDKEPPKGMFL